MTSHEHETHARARRVPRCGGARLARVCANVCWRDASATSTFWVFVIEFYINISVSANLNGPRTDEPCAASEGVALKGEKIAQAHDTLF